MKPAHHRQSTTTIPTQALRIDCSFYMAARKPTSPLRARAPASRKNGGGGPREWISRAGLPSQTPRSPPTFKRPHMGDAHPLVPTIGFQSRSTERLPTANAVGLHAVWPKAARSLPDLDAPLSTAERLQRARPAMARAERATNADAHQRPRQNHHGGAAPNHHGEDLHAKAL